MGEAIVEVPTSTGRVLRSGGESPTAVRAELDHILASQTFSRAERPSRFLKYLVEHALEGDGSGISEYVLATEIFNRKPTFDPMTDPIVRVEAGRLRRRLREYYEAEGSDDPLMIELPQRTYTPAFQRREAPALDVVRKQVARRWRIPLAVALGILAGLAVLWSARAQQAPASSGAPSIVILPFTDLSPAHDQGYFCDGLTDEVAEEVDRIEPLNVVARTSAFRLKEKPEDIREIGKRLKAELVLEGSLRKEGGRVRISVELVKTADGYRVWTQNYELDGQDVLRAEEQVARRIAAAVAPMVRR
jgi:serine/threonine-protein kinase